MALNSGARKGPLRGRAAYEADVRLNPTYHDGSLRPSWNNLSKIARWSWSRPSRGDKS
jgi:hypothetical protein